MSSTKKVWQKNDGGSSYIDQGFKRDRQSRGLLNTAPESGWRHPKRSGIKWRLKNGGQDSWTRMSLGSGVGAADYFQIKYCLNTIMKLKQESNRAKPYEGCGVGSEVARDQLADTA